MISRGEAPKAGRRQIQSLKPCFGGLAFLAGRQAHREEGRRELPCLFLSALHPLLPYALSVNTYFFRVVGD